jgi:hypothetical protein
MTGPGSGPGQDLGRPIATSFGVLPWPKLPGLLRLPCLTQGNWNDGRPWAAAVVHFCAGPHQSLLPVTFHSRFSLTESQASQISLRRHGVQSRMAQRTLIPLLNFWPRCRRQFTLQSCRPLRWLSSANTPFIPPSQPGHDPRSSPTVAADWAAETEYTHTRLASGRRQALNIPGARALGSPILCCPRLPVGEPQPWHCIPGLG